MDIASCIVFTWSTLRGWERFYILISLWRAHSMFMKLFCSHLRQHTCQCPASKQQLLLSKQDRFVLVSCPSSVTETWVTAEASTSNNKAWSFSWRATSECCLLLTQLGPRMACLFKPALLCQLIFWHWNELYVYLPAHLKIIFLIQHSNV